MVKESQSLSEIGEVVGSSIVKLRCILILTFVDRAYVPLDCLTVTICPSSPETLPTVDTQPNRLPKSPISYSSYLRSGPFAIPSPFAHLCGSLSRTLHVGVHITKYNVEPCLTSSSLDPIQEPVSRIQYQPLVSSYIAFTRIAKLDYQTPSVQATGIESRQVSKPRSGNTGPSLSPPPNSTSDSRVSYHNQPSPCGVAAARYCAYQPLIIFSLSPS
jgi:hypothetical protein